MRVQHYALVRCLIEDRQQDRHTNERIGKQTARLTDWLLDRKTDGRTESWMLEKQPNIHIRLACFFSRPQIKKHLYHCLPCTIFHSFFQFSYFVCLVFIVLVDFFILFMFDMLPIFFFYLFVKFSWFFFYNFFFPFLEISFAILNPMKPEIYHQIFKIFCLYMLKKIQFVFSEKKDFHHKTNKQINKLNFALNTEI